MGLYINKSHENIYKNNKEITEPNQGYFIKNHVAEMVEEQKQINQSLHESIKTLNHLYKLQEKQHLTKWDQVGRQFNEMNQHQREVENRFMIKLKELEARNEQLVTLIEESQLSKQKREQQIEEIGETQDDMLEVLNSYSLFYGEVSRKIDEQLSAQKLMEQKIERQENEQKQMMERMDNQEALSEKIIRQLEHFRSILFERSNYLSEKLDTLSSYVLHSLTTSGDLEKRVLVVPKKEKSNK